MAWVRATIHRAPAADPTLSEKMLCALARMVAFNVSGVLRRHRCRDGRGWQAQLDDMLVAVVDQHQYPARTGRRAPSIVWLGTAPASVSRSTVMWYVVSR